VSGAGEAASGGHTSGGSAAPILPFLELLNGSARGAAGGRTCVQLAAIEYGDRSNIPHENMTTGGDGATYAYDNFNHVRSANYGGRNLSFAYDALGRMTSQSSNLGTLSYSYDAAGDRTGMVWPDGFAITFAYNANSTLQAFWEGSSPSGGFTPMSFDYDGQNRLNSMSWLFFGRANTTYDSLSRITSASLNLPNNAGTSFNLNYNEASQLLNISNSNGMYDWPAPANFSRTYGVNGLNQVTSSNSYTFSYDAKGDLTSDGVNSYGYDVLNRLTQGPNGVSLSYDALGRLASTTNSSGATTQYLYDGQNLVATYDGSGNVTSHYVFGPGTDRPVMWYNGSGTGDRRFLMANPQGSIVGVSDVNGNLLAANTYDEFGVPGPNNQGAFQYTGQLWLANAGLYYYKARIYSPTLGRFLQTDPIGYGDGLNWYNYVHGDPVNGSDPSGTCGNSVVIDPDGTVEFTDGGPCLSGFDPSLTTIGGRGGGPIGPGIRPGGPPHPTPQSKFTIVHGTPPGAIKCSAYGMTFLAPPGFNLGNIAAAGRAGGWNLGAMNAAVGQYGSFDFQRSRGSSGNTTYYPAYQVASNVAVGAYLNGTGIPEILSNAIEDTFAFFKSSNAGNGDQIMGQEIGWDAAAGNASLSCGYGR